MPSILPGRNQPIATTAKEGMNKTTDADRNIVGFPAIKAISDGFGIIMKCVERFEVSTRPTIHTALQLLFKDMKHLDDIGNGGRYGEEPFVERYNLQFIRKSCIESYVNTCSLC